MPLIIVESPTKARTFNRILKGKAEPKATETKGAKAKAAPKAKPGPNDYYVFATLGHIRDLPGDKMSIDFEHNFKPEYKVMEKKQKVITQLQELAKDYDEIIFATDQDREGESISYHAAYLLGLMDENWPEISAKKGVGTVKRIVFHEITQKALEEALANPGEIRLDLVKAQQARRILDRIVGYELSPLLWKKLGKNWLSAGRVQTVALRFVVEREKEIRDFSKEPYYQISGLFKDGEEFKAKLISKDDVKYEQQTTLKLFAGEYTFTKTTINKDTVGPTSDDIKTDSFSVAEVEESSKKRYPPPPFSTSLLQQEAINRYGFTSKMVMRLAQDLYERGLITYHRTDSFNLSTSYVFRAKDYITATFGADYALEKPRGYRTKSASAQEAHEAIRPTKVDRMPDEIGKDKKLTKNHKLLYELVWNRALATQMKEAEIKITKVFTDGKKGYRFESDFQKVLFDGFLKVLSPEFVSRHQSDVKMKKGEQLSITEITTEEKETLAPPRYSEASLIKILEEHGIGRPSTYAAILSLIQEKGYVEREGRYLKSTPLGEAISDYLSAAFPELFSINFTATMEEDLDKIAEGQEKLLDVLTKFYGPFSKDLEVKKKDTGMIEVKEEINEVCPKCGKPLQMRYSRFGKFYACSGYPDCKFTKPFLKIVENKKCPKDGGNVVVRYTKAKKKFYGCANYPACDYTEFVWSKLVPSVPPTEKPATTTTTAV